VGVALEERQSADSMEQVMLGPPDELVTSILLQWVPVRVLHHLDSACCNTVLRKQLL
jgi:hypothetical protein